MLYQSQWGDARLRMKNVLCISGHDPTGGAGIQADIEACAAQGVHALTVISALTVQDTHNVRRVSPVAPMLMAQQIEALLEDCRVDAIKIGLLGDAQQIPYLLQAIAQAKVPVVLDPILRAGGGANLTALELQAAMEETLFPQVTLLTPNAAEARRFAPRAPTLDGCGAALLSRGCANVLITGGDESTSSVINTWYAPHAAPKHYEHARIPGSFHGAGCTLASAIAARLACGDAMSAALETAQAYAQQSLARAKAIGHGRKIPGRWL